VVRLRTSFLLLILLAGGSINCLLDTGPTNRLPTVQIEELNHPLYRGQETTFKATAYDPDQDTDSLAIAWYLDDNCDRAIANEQVSCLNGGGTACSYKPEKLGQLCVVAEVSDRHGGKATASRKFTVENRAPTAVIVRTVPASTSTTFPLQTSLTFSAADSSDPDPDETARLTYQWTVTQPDGKKLSANTCPSAQSPATCSFTSQDSGSYRVQLVVTDPNKADSPPATLDVVIDQDRPPCIDGVSPTTQSRTIAFVDQTNSLIVTLVNDDVDSYPGSSPGTFTWYLRRGTSGEFARLNETFNSNRLDIGVGAFMVGDLVQFRVEYRDRIKRDFSACTNTNSTRCELNPGCAQWVTWEVLFL
jgi:hypothetical protein